MAFSSSYDPSTAFLELAGPAGAPFFDFVEPASFPMTRIRYKNQQWASQIGIHDLNDDEWIEHFAKFVPLRDNLPKPMALRYHGHQFRAYNSDIGDGRGFLFAQLKDTQGRLLDLGTKGSGQTPYSRFGDGRLTLKGGVREVLATELLEALGVYTSKSFSLIETGEELERGDEPSPARSAVLVRLGHSHVRFGAFQRLAFEENADAIERLVDYCVAAFDPDLAAFPAEKKPALFFERVVARTAQLVAQWMAAGFVHGVLNTDNMNVTGESFDYGPWRFIPTLDPGFTAAYFDQTGLYAYGRQAEAGAWNLAKLGGALALICDIDLLNKALQTYQSRFMSAMGTAFLQRFGLKPTGQEDFETISGLLQWMQKKDVPFERVFFDWFCGRASNDRRKESPINHLYNEEDFKPIAAALQNFEPDRPARLQADYFQRHDPLTMLIDEVEAIWAPIADADDWTLFETKLADIDEMRRAYGFSASSYQNNLLAGD